MNFEKEMCERRRKGLMSYERNFMKMSIYSSGSYRHDHILNQLKVYLSSFCRPSKLTGESTYVHLRNAMIIF